MNKTMLATAAAAIALVTVSPALARDHHRRPPSPDGSATSVPEPTDAVLLLMGAVGVVVGRRLHARKTKD